MKVGEIYEYFWDLSQKKEREYFEMQIKGLILILNDYEEDGMIQIEYVRQKLESILSTGIGFHTNILRFLMGEDGD